MMKIVNRYILSTFLNNFLLYLSIITSLLLLNYFYQLINLFITYRTEVITVLKTIFFLLPTIVSITLPVTILISVLLTFSVLNETKELLILETSGIKKSLYVTNFIFISIFAALVSVYFNTYFVPHSYKKFSETILTSVISKPALNFKNNVTIVQDIKIVAKNVVKQKNNTIQLSDVFIYNPVKNYNVLQTIHAEDAVVNNDIYGDIMFHLHNGNIININNNNYHEIVYIKFKTYQFKIYSSSIRKLISEERKSLREMTNKQLLKMLNQNFPVEYIKKILSEFFIRYTISIAVIVFTLFGITAGLRIKSNAKPLSFIIAIIIILLYYFLLTLSISLVENTNVKPTLYIAGMIMQLPNITILLITMTILLFFKTV